MARKYTRNFIALRQEHQDYTMKGKEATGKCIIEIRDGTGKMAFSAQNLLPENIYKVYLICGGAAENLGVLMGSLHVDEKGRGELKCEFNPDNVGGCGKDIDEFIVAAILFIKQEGIVAPLVGYKQEEITWKKTFREFKGHSQEMAAAAPKEPEGQPAGTPEDLPEGTNAAPERIEKEQGAGSTGAEPGGDSSCSGKTEKEIKEVHLDKGQIPSPTVLKGEAATQKDFFDNDEASIHEGFKSMAKKFNESMNELQNYTIANEDGTKAAAKKNEKIEDYKITDNLDYIFHTYPKMEPFSAQKKDVVWIRISLKELIYFPYQQWELMNEPFIVSSYKQHSHLLMGKAGEGEEVEIFLGVADTYARRKELQAKALGFQQFKCTDNTYPEEGKHGYWIAGTIL